MFSQFADHFLTPKPWKRIIQNQSCFLTYGQACLPVFLPKVGLPAAGRDEGGTPVSLGGILTGMTMGLDTITYTVTNSCGTASATLPVSVVGSASCDTVSWVKYFQVETPIRIFPNPNKGVFTLSLPPGNHINLVIPDMSGREILNGDALTGKENTINLEDATQGFYFINLNIDGVFHHRYFIIE